MANSRSSYRVFDVHFGSTSLLAVDAEVKNNMDNGAPLDFDGGDAQLRYVGQISPM